MTSYQIYLGLLLLLGIGVCAFGILAPRNRAASDKQPALANERE